MNFAEALAGQGYSGTVGLLVSDFNGRELYSVNATRPFPAASTIKVPLLLVALGLVQRGELDLNERVTMQASDRVPGAGILFELDSGLSLTWRDVLTLMMVVSDNTATNLLIERLGVEHVNAWLHEHGLNATRLVGRLQLLPELQNEAQRRGERNRTSAQEQARLLLGLVGRTVLAGLLDEAHTRLALDILERQHLRGLIGPGIPADQNGQPLYRLASKSGELRGVHHDVGLLYTPRPLVVALLSEGGSDPRSRPGNRDARLLAQTLWPLLAELGQVAAHKNGGDI